MLMRPTHSRVIMPAVITGRDSTARYSAMRGPTAAWRAISGPFSGSACISQTCHKRLMHRSKRHLYSITSSARLSNVAGISMPSALAVLSGVSNRVLNYREFSLGPNCAFRFNFQRAVQRGQASYVIAVMAPSDFAQL
jgi:hypothetical protein